MKDTKEDIEKRAREKDTKDEKEKGVERKIRRKRKG